MTDDISIEDLLARLERERIAADHLYNDALTALDRALQVAPVLPHAPPSYDPSRLEAVNRAWDILPNGVPAFDTSLKGRLGRFIWRMIGPSIETQRQFNAALVEHLNRNVASHAESTAALREMIGLVGRELRALVAFESLLIQFLQTITVYVDSKDRSLGGPDIRQRLALTEQRLLALKRVLDSAALPASQAGPQSTTEPTAPFAGAVDSVTYVAFEDQFRGPQEEILRRVQDYVPILSTATDVLDVGCGRGELLGLLRDSGIRARGIDVSPAMVALCRSRGLDAEEADAVSYLRRQDDESIGGLIAIQVVEHFAPSYLTAFLEAAFHKMRPRAALVLETINPSCWMAFFETYLRDLTHRQPLHADTLRHLVQASGFTDVEVQFRSPVRDRDRLDHVSAAAVAGGGQGVEALIAAVNDHAHKLNERLFSSMDYVVVARR